MTDTTTQQLLAYYARHACALFPIPAGQKNPTGIVQSFGQDHSAAVEQWAAWSLANPGCNWGLVAGPSRLIVVDIDTKEGRDAAWNAWCELCASWGIPVALPHVHTQSGGWHCYFSVPTEVDSATLRQPDAIKKIINVRAGNGYVVAPPSQVDGRPYSFLSDAAPYPAPAALIAHCTRAARSAGPAPNLGTHDINHVAGLITWLAERETFAAYEDWVSVGMALKLEFGDAGLDLWQLTHDETVTPEVEASKWASFATEPTPGVVTLNSWMHRAHKAGWVGSIHRSKQAMFGNVVEQLAAQSGAINEAAKTTPLHDASESEMTVVPFPAPVPQYKPVSRIRPRRINAATLHGKPVPEREWMVPGLIPAGNVTLMYGDGGTGKTLLALLLCTTAITGTHFFGRPVTKGGVEFVTAEDSVDEMHRRLQDIARVTNKALSDFDGLHITSLADEDALLAVAEDGRGGTLVVTALYQELDGLLSESRPALLVLDTLADVYGGNEIVRSQVRQFVGMLRRLSLKHGCTVLVLAHPSLSGMEKGTSGSTGWSNSVRSRLYLNRIFDTDGSEPNEDARVLRVGKSNYGRVGLEIPMRWQAGTFVPIETTGGEHVMQAAKAERVFLELLEKYTRQERPVSLSTGANYAPKLFETEARTHGIRKRDLATAMGRLLDNGRVANVPYGPPSRGTKRLVVSSRAGKGADAPASAPANGVQTGVHTHPL